ncbi:DUF6404 family protein [Oligoflexus sp.]|uniref:DUF6404 family protein n=1 Tax=Oligoflexus sp. TaxID=1971216 RepID=UPI0039C9E268
MTFQEKLRHALDLCQDSKIKSYDYQPPLYKLLWRLGIEKAPPHFTGFYENWISIGTITGIPWTLIMAAPGLFQDVSRSDFFPLLVGGCCSSVFYGYLMAKRCERQAKRFGIPLWKDFFPPE